MTTCDPFDWFDLNLYSDEPLDPAQVAADHALIEAVGAGQIPVVPADATHPGLLASMVAAWRETIEHGPPPVADALTGRPWK